MRFIVFLLTFLFSLPCLAQLKEYAHLYDVDADEQIPLVWRLEKEYSKEHALYDWRYKFNWAMPKQFDKDFQQSIINFGTIEKRIDNPDEESLLRDLKRIPKEFYPYIGPVLHTVRGLSGKILDLPGIKETKNKFPERIASVFKDVPNIEYASPELYFYLMPEIWGEGASAIEYPKIRPQKPSPLRVRINPKFLETIKKNVPIENYTEGHRPPEPDMGVRHFYADKNTPLSGADVKAFIATIGDVKEFLQQNDNEIQLILIDSLINYWDEKNGVNRYVSFLKGAVNPCQTIARKIKWKGMRSEFQQYIGKNGFGLDDWAYTCDKTLKAYRVLTMPNAYITSLRLLKKGYLYEMWKYMDFTSEEREIQKYFIEASIHLYDSTRADVEAVTPFRYQLQDAWIELGDQYGGTPILIP